MGRVGRRSQQRQAQLAGGEVAAIEAIIDDRQGALLPTADHGDPFLGYGLLAVFRQALDAASHLAKELRCSWDSVNTATRVYGAALLAADTKRLKETTAIGLDETLFLRSGPCKKKAWSTTVCDVVNHQLIDIVPTREFTEVAG